MTSLGRGHPEIHRCFPVTDTVNLPVVPVVPFCVTMVTSLTAIS